jgi:hypothetical protein
VSSCRVMTDGGTARRHVPGVFTGLELLGEGAERVRLTGQAATFCDGTLVLTEYCTVVSTWYSDTDCGFLLYV